MKHVENGTKNTHLSLSRSKRVFSEVSIDFIRLLMVNIVETMKKTQMTNITMKSRNIVTNIPIISPSNVVINLCSNERNMITNEYTARVK